MKSGRNSVSENQKRFSNFVRQWNDCLEPFARSWESAKNLFYPDRMDATLQEALKRADVVLAGRLVLLACLIALACCLLMSFESMKLAEYMAQTFADMVGIPAPVADPMDLAKLVVFYLVLQVPIPLTTVYLQEIAAFRLMRLTGGKGTFAQQFYLSSIITLSLSFLAVFYLFIPLPALPCVVIPAIFLVGAYLAFYVNCKAYALVHGTGYLHALAIYLPLSVLRMIMLYYVGDALTGMLDPPQVILY